MYIAAHIEGHLVINNSIKLLLKNKKSSHKVPMNNSPKSFCESIERIVEPGNHVNHCLVK